jgi:N-acetylneuraminate synthase
MRAFVIAEAGVNHNGNPELAKEMVRRAADAGADAVKFQVFSAAELASARAVKAPYQTRSGPRGQSQREMLAGLELRGQDFEDLAELADSLGIEFLATPFDGESLKLLHGLGVKRLKLSSGDLTTGPLVLACARTQLPLILSTGMATPDEITETLGLLAWGYGNAEGNPPADLRAEDRNGLRDKVTILQCTTEYPCPYDSIHLRAMDYLRKTYDLAVGYSDHSIGFHIAVAAVARGASIVEKHFTLDRSLPGPDHGASLVPSELREMISQIRDIESAIGNEEKAPSPCEELNKMVARKSLVAARTIRRGEPFTEENLTAKRPGSGISPMSHWKFLGRKASRDYAPDDPLDE